MSKKAYKDYCQRYRSTMTLGRNYGTRCMASAKDLERKRKPVIIDWCLYAWVLQWWNQWDLSQHEVSWQFTRGRMYRHNLPRSAPLATIPNCEFDWLGQSGLSNSLFWRAAILALESGELQECMALWPWGIWKSTSRSWCQRICRKRNRENHVVCTRKCFEGKLGKGMLL